MESHDDLHAGGTWHLKEQKNDKYQLSKNLTKYPSWKCIESKNVSLNSSKKLYTSTFIDPYWAFIEICCIHTEDYKQTKLVLEWKEQQHGCKWKKERFIIKENTLLKDGKSVSELVIPEAIPTDVSCAYYIYLPI